MKTWALRVAVIYFILINVVVGLIAASSLFTTDNPLPRDGQVLVSTFGIGMALSGLVITLAGFRRRAVWAWVALWYLPIFFVIHVIAFGTMIPDGLFAVLTVGALLLGWPLAGSRSNASGSGVEALAGRG